MTKKLHIHVTNKIFQTFLRLFRAVWASSVAYEWVKLHSTQQNNNPQIVGVCQAPLSLLKYNPVGDAMLSQVSQELAVKLNSTLIIVLML